MTATGSPKTIVAWCFAGLVLLNVAAGIALMLRDAGWRETREASGRVWRKGGVMHVDRNGDGRVDEIEEPGGAGGTRRVWRDTDGDGYLDVTYLLGTNGVASRTEAIREPAPRH